MLACMHRHCSQKKREKEPVKGCESSENTAVHIAGVATQPAFSLAGTASENGDIVMREEVSFANSIRSALLPQSRWKDRVLLLPWLVTIWARVSRSQEHAVFLLKKKKKSSWGEEKKKPHISCFVLSLFEQIFMRILLCASIVLVRWMRRVL